MRGLKRKMLSMIWPIRSIYFRTSVCESGMIRKGQYFSGEWLKQRFLCIQYPPALEQCSIAAGDAQQYTGVYHHEWIGNSCRPTTVVETNTFLTCPDLACDLKTLLCNSSCEHLTIDGCYPLTEFTLNWNYRGQTDANSSSMSISWCILHCFVASFTYSRPISGKFRCIFICFFSFASPWPCWGACNTFITDRGRPQVAHGMKMNKYIYKCSCPLFISNMYT